MFESDQMGMEPALPMAVGLGLPTVAEIDESVKGDLMGKPEKDIPKERADLVKKWVERVKESRQHAQKRFEKMREDQKFVRGEQWKGQTENDERYVANITQRHVNQRVAALYAKNPTVVAKRRPTMDFVIWDERPESLKEAMMVLAQARQTVAMGGNVGMIPPHVAVQIEQASALLKEVQEAKTKRSMMDRMGRTLEILFNYYMNEQEPVFKTQAKQLIRRVETCGVGYVKLGFQRQMQRRPEVSAELGDLTQRLSYLQRLAHEANEDGGDGYEIEELRAAINTLQQEPEIIIKEGLVFDFPRSDAIIVDKRCINLKGFIGADFIAHQFLFSHEEIEEIYKIDLEGKVTAHYESSADGVLREASGQSNNNKDAACGKVLVFEIYHKPSGEMMTVADGYDDFITEPAPPPVRLERFWPIFTLTFNDVEDSKDIYPDSDVRLLRPIQVEHNRSREGLREHRIANRPAYGSPKGVLEKEDKSKLMNHDINELIEFNVPVGTDIKTVIQPMAKVPVDPNVYDTSPFFDDLQKVVGAQEANFGGVSGVAATEVSVAEGSRISTLQSNIDDLDEFLSELARGASQIMLREVTKETAVKIAGPGAVWPELSAQEIADELYLTIEAGSSGRPNRAQEIANWERITPILMQTPNINPSWVSKKVVRTIDDAVDLTEAIVEGMPSMTALNAMAGNPQPGTGDPASDPAQQGRAGADKTKNPQDTGGGGQPSFRQPGDNEG